MDRESEVKDGDQVLQQFEKGVHTLPYTYSCIHVLIIAGISFENVYFSYPSRPEESVLKVSVHSV